MLAGLHVTSHDFHVKLEVAGGRVIYKISVKTDNPLMNGSDVEIIKITIFQTKSDDAAN